MEETKASMSDISKKLDLLLEIALPRMEGAHGSVSSPIAQNLERDADAPRAAKKHAGTIENEGNLAMAATLGTEKTCSASGVSQENWGGNWPDSLNHGTSLCKTP